MASLGGKTLLVPGQGELEMGLSDVLRDRGSYKKIFGP